MTASGARGDASDPGLPRLTGALAILATWMGAGLRPVRSPARARLMIPAWRRYAWHGVVLTAIAAAAMVWLDASAIRAANRLPDWINVAFNEFTDFGQAQWFLVPFGVLYLVAVAAASKQVGHFTYGVLGVLAVRFGFMFLAIGLPGLAGTVVKRLIGRVRPSELGPFAYEPFAWRTEYASLPSGHATIAFAAAVAVGAIVPRARAILWLYAVLIAASRVVVSTHYPSDVIVGAAFGAFGAILVRDWFAARRLGFHVGSDGAVRPLPGTSWSRIKRVAAALSGQ